MFSMSSKTKRRKSSAGKNVLIFFIVFMILELLIVVGLSLLFKNKDSTPGIAGYHFYVMKSDKMGDVVPKGSLVVASNGTPSKDKINSAILCTDVEGIGTSVFWLDSIESKEGQDGVEYTIFQKNDPDTKYKIKSSNIVGIANTYYKTAGKIISFITSTIGMVICIAIPLFLLILIELIIAIVKHSSADEYEDDYDDEYDDEYDEYDDDYYDDDDRDSRDRDRDDRNGRRDRRSDTPEYDDEDFRRPMRKQRDTKKNSVQLDDFLYGGDKDPEKIAKRHGQQHRPAQNRQQQPRKRDEAEFSKKHDLDSAYLEEASKIADKTKEVPKQAPKTRPAPHNKPAHRPAPAPQKSTGTATSNSIEDLMKMMDEEQQKLRNKMDN